MTDIVDEATRSRIMRAVPRADTKPERALRLRLHAMGFRYRLGGCSLPGSPDLVFPRYRAVVFVHGCFWHRHPGCPRATTPKSRTDYWLPKFQESIRRDQAVQTALRALGWRIAIVWECELLKTRADATARCIAAWLRGSDADGTINATDGLPRARTPMD